MPSDFILRGAELDPAPDDDFALLYGDEVGYPVRHAVATTEVARGAPATVELTGEDDDVIEVEDVDGVVRFHLSPPEPPCSSCVPASGCGRRDCDGN